MAPISWGEYPRALRFSPHSIGSFVEHEAYKKYFVNKNHVQVGNYPNKFLTIKPKLFVDTEMVKIMSSIGMNMFDDEMGLTQGSVEVIYKDASKYNAPNTANINWEVMHRACGMLRSQFSFLKGFKSLSPQEAIARMDPTKSPGFPHTLAYPTKGMVISYHYDWLVSRLESANRMEPIPTPMVSTTWKEEIRKLQKILEGKVRSMCPVSIETCALFLMVFGRAMDAVSLMDWRKTEMTVGFSPWYGGWDDFATWFEDCDAFMDFDVEKFDSHVFNELRMFLFDYFWIPMMTTPEQMRVARNVVESLLFPIVVFPDGNMMRFLRGGRWSGEPLTALENSLLSILLFYYCCLRMGYSEEQIKVKFKKVFLGDDNYIGKRFDPLQDFKFGLPVFTAEQYIFFMRECNFPIGEHDGRWRPVWETPFCSMTTNKEKFNGVYTFTPDVPKICYSMSVSKRTMTLGDKMSKRIQLYQYLLFTPWRDAARKVVEEFFYLHSAENDVVEIYFANFPPTLYRMYLPVRHGRSLNVAANKSLLDVYQEKGMNYVFEGRKYCGPWLNKGKIQASQPAQQDDPEPIDEMDRGCKKHDECYATPGSDLLKCDDDLALIASEQREYLIEGAMRVQAQLRKAGILSQYQDGQLSASDLHEVERRVDQMILKDEEMPQRKRNKQKEKTLKKVKKEIKELKKIRRRRPKANGAPKKGATHTKPKTVAPFMVQDTSIQPGMRKQNSRTIPIQRIPLRSYAPGTNDAQGLIYISQKVSPFMSFNTEEAQAAKWYERFRVKRMRICFESSCLATSGGQFWVLYDPDVSDKYKVGSTADYQSLSISQNRFWVRPYFQEKKFATEWLSRKQLGWISTPQQDFEQNLRYAGQFVIGNSLAPGTSAQLGQFFLEVEFEFVDRNAEYDIDMLTYCHNGWVNTDSTYVMDDNLILGDLSFGNIDEIYGIKLFTDGTNIYAQFSVPGDYFFSFASSPGKAYSVAPTYLATDGNCAVFAFGTGLNGTNGTLQVGWIRKTVDLGTTATVTMSLGEWATTSVGATSYNEIQIFRAPLRVAQHTFDGTIPEGRPTNFANIISQVMRRMTIDRLPPTPKKDLLQGKLIKEGKAEIIKDGKTEICEKQVLFPNTDVADTASPFKGKIVIPEFPKLDPSDAKMLMEMNLYKSYVSEWRENRQLTVPAYLFSVPENTDEEVIDV